MREVFTCFTGLLDVLTIDKRSIRINTRKSIFVLYFYFYLLLSIIDTSALFSNKYLE